MDASTARGSPAASAGDNGNGCIEVAFLPDGTVGVRDTKDRTRPALAVSPPAAWAAFLTATRTGRFTPLTLTPARSVISCGDNASIGGNRPRTVGEVGGMTTYDLARSPRPVVAPDRP